MFSIFGSPRSGTTLLGVCLDQHSKIAVTYEAHINVVLSVLMRRMTGEQKGKKAVFHFLVNSDNYEYNFGEFFTEDELWEVIMAGPYDPPAMIEHLYHHLALKRGKQIAGDKTPTDVGASWILNSHGFFRSNVKVLHIVRDVRDVVLSNKEMFWAKQNYEKHFTDIWERNASLHDMFNKLRWYDKSRYHFLHYEELVVNPRKVLEGVCEFLGVEFEEAMLATDPQLSRIRQIQAKFDHHKNLNKPINPEKVLLWRDKMDEEQLKRVETKCRKTLLQMGYPLSEASTGVPADELKLLTPGEEGDPTRQVVATFPRRGAVTA